LRDEIGLKKHLNRTVVGNRMIMGRAYNMGDSKLPHKVWRAEEKGEGRRERPRLKWEDSLKGNIGRAGMNTDGWSLQKTEMWNKLTGNR